MNCVFTVTPLDDGNYRHDCPVCKVPVVSPAKRHIRVCWPEGVERPPPPPSLGQRLANFSVAAIGHLLSGCPTCSQEQIDARYEICQACPLYRPDKHNPNVGICTHPKCGCGVSREQQFLSKLAWLDQSCPLGKWPPIVD